MVKVNDIYEITALHEVSMTTRNVLFNSIPVLIEVEGRELVMKTDKIKRETALHCA